MAAFDDTLSQIPLALSWDRQCTLENFYLHKGNDLAFQTIFRIASCDFHGPTAVVLFGPQGVGKTHLLLGLFHAFNAPGKQPSVQYMCGNRTRVASLSGTDLLLVDDLPTLSAEHQRWIFSVYNDFLRSEKRVVFASRIAPWDLKGFADDLRNRLESGLAVQLRQPDEDGLGKILFKLALDRNLVLSADIASFLLSRIERTVPSLVQAADQIEQFSLAGKKAVTIPLVKRALGI